MRQRRDATLEHELGQQVVIGRTLLQRVKVGECLLANLLRVGNQPIPLLEITVTHPIRPKAKVKRSITKRQPVRLVSTDFDTRPTDTLTSNISDSAIAGFISLRFLISQLRQLHTNPATVTTVFSVKFGNSMSSCTRAREEIKDDIVIVGR